MCHTCGQYDLVGVVHEDVAGLVHAPVQTVVAGGDLAVVVDLTRPQRRRPAGGRLQEGVDWPGPHLQEARLGGEGRNNVRLHSHLHLGHLRTLLSKATCISIVRR